MKWIDIVKTGNTGLNNAAINLMGEYQHVVRFYNRDFNGTHFTGCRFRLKCRRTLGFFFLPLEICDFKFQTRFRRLRRGFFDFLGSKIEIAL